MLIRCSLGLALGCLGTETDGSITSPSSFNNLVGIKPSRYIHCSVIEHAVD